MKTKSIAVIALAGVVFLADSAFGQAGANRRPAQERQRMRENVVTLRLLRLTKALDLTEEQAAKVFPLVNRLEKEKAEAQRRMTEDLQGLRALLLDPEGKDVEIEAKLGNLKASRREIQAKDDELEAYVEANLTAVQKARFVIFNIEFYRGLADALERARMRLGREPGPPIKK
jgi:Spy/CpxP family protein refolding chaperone